MIDAGQPRIDVALEHEPACLHMPCQTAYLNTGCAAATVGAAAVWRARFASASDAVRSAATVVHPGQ